MTRADVRPAQRTRLHAQGLRAAGPEVSRRPRPQVTGSSAALPYPAALEARPLAQRCMNQRRNRCRNQPEPGSAGSKVSCQTIAVPPPCGANSTRAR